MRIDKYNIHTIIAFRGSGLLVKDTALVLRNGLVEPHPERVSRRAGQVRIPAKQARIPSVSRRLIRHTVGPYDLP